MPVKLEILQQLNVDDRRDIDKILVETQDAVSTQHSADTLETQLAEGNHWLFAGRFNDRIVGIILATHQQNTSESVPVTQLTFAGVRRLTQRRGVMHQMMILVERWADNKQCALAIQQPPQHLQTALANRHFCHHGECWVYRPSH